MTRAGVLAPPAATRTTHAPVAWCEVGVRAAAGGPRHAPSAPARHRSADAVAVWHGGGRGGVAAEGCPPRSPRHGTAAARTARPCHGRRWQHDTRQPLTPFPPPRLPKPSRSRRDGKKQTAKNARGGGAGRPTRRVRAGDALQSARTPPPPPSPPIRISPVPHCHNSPPATAVDAGTASRRPGRAPLRQWIVLAPAQTAAARCRPPHLCSPLPTLPALTSESASEPWTRTLGAATTRPASPAGPPLS